MAGTGTKKTRPRLGQQIIEGLADAVATARARARAGSRTALRRKYAVRRVKLLPLVHPELGPEDVAAIRNSLDASQAVFAGLIGVSPGAVRAWEQGRKTPSTLAHRLLAEVKRNRGYWQERLRSMEGKIERRGSRPQMTFDWSPVTAPHGRAKPRPRRPAMPQFRGVHPPS